MSAMSASTCAISSLPYELLVAVAVASQEDCVVDSNWETESTTFKAEWTLSHVSRRFRDVVVGAPALWTLIEMDFTGEGSVEILNLYLERSRTSKISLILREPESCMTVDGLLRERVTEIIVPQVNRIQRLKIVLRAKDWDLDQEMLGPFRDVAAPHLEHLEIVYRGGEFAVGVPVAMFWSGAPRLTFLKIDRSTLQLPPQPLWMASITHLELLGGYDPDIYPAAVTAQCPSLTHLHLDVTYVPTDANRFHIPTLKFLYISIQDNERADYVSYIVALFDVPALAELILNGSHGDQVAFLLCLKSLPQSSFPVLTSISFICRGSCLCETQPVLPYHPLSSPPVLFPALSHLILINQCHAYALIKDILGPVSHPWPLLKTITLGAVDDSFEEVGAAVEDAVDSKCQHGEPVPEVRLFRVLSSLEDWDENSPVDVERSW
ncbi:hypothetical protein DFH08DRAFT_932895 [Mycena albidolilacea]|uniref:F-box domain-containing protein n=1 Tax=Mycena albidolilacea TaxID=1033008 RepID=A0AAD7AFE7_9AGAR|nr:hypothetical protein DFH08DRAFT_932895 [Mycena albidolilacea]